MASDLGLHFLLYLFDFVKNNLIKTNKINLMHLNFEMDLSKVTEEYNRRPEWVTKYASRLAEFKNVH